MKEHRSWSCDFCGTEYSSREEAAACESSHHRATGTGSMIYSGPAAEYPDYLRVDFESGISRTYVLSQGYQYLGPVRRT